MRAVLRYECVKLVTARLKNSAKLDYTPEEQQTWDGCISERNRATAELIFQIEPYNYRTDHTQKEGAGQNYELASKNRTLKFSKKITKKEGKRVGS